MQPQQIKACAVLSSGTYFYSDASTLSKSENKAMPFTSVEEAWLFLEDLGLKEHHAVKTPTGIIRSGISDKYMAMLKGKHPKGVTFIREKKQYMLTLA